MRFDFIFIFLVLSLGDVESGDAIARRIPASRMDGLRTTARAARGGADLRIDLVKCESASPKAG
jgi:hypothetical protein